MNPLPTNPLKGMLDFPPHLMEQHNYLKKVIDQTAELMGYEEYDLPILESMEVFSVKSNEEILREQTYSFVDRGDREVVLRPEITPSLARLIAKEHQHYYRPIRWYTVGRCYRYERPQKGRLREFHQLNFDLLGEQHFVYDMEIFKVILQLMKNFGVKEEQYVVSYNHRGWVDGLLERMGFEAEEKKSFYHWVDRRKKVTQATFDQAIKSVWHDQEEKLDFINLYLDASTPQKLEDKLHQNFSKRFPLDRDLDQATDDFLKFETNLSSQTTSHLKYDPTIVRGFDYYTGIVFEVFALSGDIRRSLFGGGRYDRLTSSYLKEPISGVGFGMGLYIFSLYLKEIALLPEKKPFKSGFYLAPLSEKVLVYAEKISQKLLGQRKANTLHPPQSLKKHLQTATRLGYTKVILVGEDELDRGHYIVKDLNTSKQEVRSFLEHGEAES